MAISDKLTSIQNHLKDDWDSVESLIGDTELDKNIENISSALDDLYDDLPKVTGSGTSITLDDTRKGRLESTLNGNTSQFTTTGKNLLPNERATITESGITITKNDDGTYKVNGTASADISLAINENTFISMSGTWRMLGCPSGGSENTYMLSAYVGYWGTASPNIDTGNGTNITYTGNVKVRFYIKSGTTCNNLIFKPMLTTDTTATIDNFEPYTGGQASPNPDYPQDIHVVSGDNKINVVGKNLLPISTLATQTKNGITFTNNNNGSYTFNGTASAYTTFVLNNNLSFNGNYTYVMRDTATSGFVMYLQNSSGQGIGQATTHTTIDNSIGIMVIGINNGVSLNNVTIKPYVYKGAYDSTIEYEPYQGNTYPIYLGVPNLFKGYANMTNGFLPSNGSYPTTNSSFPNAKYSLIYLKQGQSVSTYGSTNSNGRIRYIDKDINQVIGGVSTTETAYYKSTADYQGSFAEGTITAKKDFILGIMVLTESSQYSDFQITYGTTPQTISPNPIELAEISTYNDEIFRTCGKNLLPNNATTQTINGVTFTINNGKSVTLNGTASAIADLYVYGSSTDTGEYIYIPKGTYSISEPSSGWFYIGREKTLGAVVGNSALLNALSSQDCYFYGFIIRATSGSSFSNLTLYPQIEKGSSATEYNPYGTGEWYWKKRIEKANLKDKSIALQSINSYNIANFLVQPIETDVPDTSLYNYSLCNRFSVQTTSIANTQTEGFLRTLNGEIHSLGVYIRIKSERANTVETFKTWLENNTTYYSWVLFKPTYTKITSSNYPTLYSQLETIYNAQGYENQTNISQTNNDLPFKITASALKEWSV